MGFVQWPGALPRKVNQAFTRVKSISSWYEIFEIDTDTYAILEPHHHEEVISYLVIGSERAALVDTGMGIVDLKPEIDRLCNKPIVVINTHGHLDHVGSNHQFSDVRVFDHEFEVDLVEKGYSHEQSLTFMKPGSYLNLPPEFNLDTYEIAASPVAKRLQHLDLVSLGNRSLKVYHTPGHSPGSICLLESPGKLLFTGDTIYPGTIVAHLKGSDPEAYLNSLKLLNKIQEQISYLCPGHNEVILPKSSLSEVLKAFQKSITNQVPFERKNNVRVFDFDGFLLVLP